MSDARTFVEANTQLLHAPLVPQIALHLASEVLPLWQMTESELEASGLPPPYWAFAWAGGQALARYVLDTPGIVAGKRVLDFGSGSGIVAIAAAKAGAGRVLAAEIDDFACAAIALNATANDVGVDIVTRDVIGEDGHGDVILVGDMCYEQPLAGHIEAWLRMLARSGILVLLGDPGRSYFPKSGLEELARYKVATSRDLEDRDVRDTGVWRLLP